LASEAVATVVEAMTLPAASVPHRHPVQTFEPGAGRGRHRPESFACEAVGSAPAAKAMASMSAPHRARGHGFGLDGGRPPSGGPML